MNLLKNIQEVAGVLARRWGFKPEVRSMSTSLVGHSSLPLINATAIIQCGQTAASMDDGKPSRLELYVRLSVAFLIIDCMPI